MAAYEELVANSKICIKIISYNKTNTFTKITNNLTKDTETDSVWGSYGKYFYNSYTKSWMENFSYQKLIEGYSRYRDLFKCEK